MSRLLVLRPEPGATATAEAAAALGLDCVVAPLFTIAPVAWTPPNPAGFDALMLTSANAVRHAGAALQTYRALPAFAVGAATAEAARRAGLAVAHAGVGDAVALLEEMVGRGIGRPLHLAGAEHRVATVAGIAPLSVIVYRSDAASELPSAARAALEEGAVALLHSPRAAACLAALVDSAGLKRDTIEAAAISAAAGSALGTGWRGIGIAAQPTDAALLAVAAGMCEERRTASGTTG